MANIPGAVTDPSRVRGENVDLTSGGDTITGYLARPSQSGNYPGIVVIHEAFEVDEGIEGRNRGSGAERGLYDAAGACGRPTGTAAPAGATAGETTLRR